MAGAFGQLGDQVKSVFRRLSIGQKVGLILVILIALGGIFGVVRWAGAPSYVQLFSNLPADEAGRIVDWLSENKIPYKLEMGGSRILIPKDKVYDARIRLAQEGLPSARSTGYEIFDETNLGMSEFVQKLNYRRALEGAAGPAAAHGAQVAGRGAPDRPGQRAAQEVGAAGEIDLHRAPGRGDHRG